MALSALAPSAALLQWDDAAGGLVHGADGRPAVVDSWLVWHGRVRGYGLHWARFARSVAEYGITGLDGFRAAVTELLPRSGLWFPRLELHLAPRPRLAVRLREAPALKRTARVWVYRGADPRLRPDRKGPDFVSQEALREKALAQGADEAILLDALGRVREGAFSTVLWWDGAEICTAKEDGKILPGITRRLILDRCAELAIGVRYECSPPSDLEGREVWITSALHGIRTVSHWDGRPTHTVHTRRLAAFRSYLSSLLLPLARP